MINAAFCSIQKLLTQISHPKRIMELSMHSLQNCHSGIFMHSRTKKYILILCCKTKEFFLMAGLLFSTHSDCHEQTW